MDFGICKENDAVGRSFVFAVAKLQQKAKIKNAAFHMMEKLFLNWIESRREFFYFGTLHYHVHSVEFHDFRFNLLYFSFKSINHQFILYVNIIWKLLAIIH